MGILHTFLLVLVGSLGSLALEDLERKALIFPEASNTAHVVLRAARQQSLTSFTVCLRSYTDLNRAYSLFSYATRKSDNELLVFKPKSNQYSLYVGGSVVTFSIADNPVPKPQWEHICVSWESATGIVEFWLNGDHLPRKGVKKGYTIGSEASIVLGQEQDSFGGGFDVNQSFVGEITDVCLWDRVLSSDELALVGNGRRLSNYLVDWRSLNYEIKGYAVVKPSLFSPYRASM
uniref:serum amyloid P-component-like n=1 Tax=Euleptes europaea TaxID=460621 RepID=UPI002540FC7B|nr:serum amyloid P-component-like [Euleptes europaea]